MRYNPVKISPLALSPFARFVTLISLSLSVSCLPLMAQSNAGQIAPQALSQDSSQAFPQAPSSDDKPSALSVELDGLHDDCLDRVGEDAEQGYEEALQWKGDGGGRRARHCIAMALFALGHRDEAAYRLEELAGEAFTGTPDMRGSLYAQAADFWLAAGEDKRAYQTAAKGLEIAKENIDLRLARARAYVQLEHLDYAEVDLTSALAFHPGHEATLRYRADVRRRLGKLDEALRDIEQAMQINPLSVENALVRGQINEDIRLKALKTE